MHNRPRAGTAHLVEVHGQSASVALHEARRLLATIAAGLGKPVAMIVSDLKPEPKETTMKKKRAQQKCRICTKPGHNAKSCTEKPAAPLPADRRQVNKAGQPRGSLAEIAARSSNGAGADLVAKAKADARALVKSKIDDELTMARAYVAELERLASA